jgi:PPM family protein phosphatase
MSKVSSYGKTDVGLKRTNNQDNLLIDDSKMLYAVADGMGGHRGGETASKVALEVIHAAMSQVIGKPGLKIVPFIKETISLASMKVYERSQMDENLRGMGTTLIAAYIEDDKCYIAQVGDSRAYLYKDGNLWKITEDHSLINEQLRSGLITKEQSEKLLYKNVITRSVGVEEIVDVDIYIREIEEGDVFLLCSDGLTSMLKDSDISDNIDVSDLKSSTERLINLANEAGGLDNISVIIIRVDQI